MPILKIKIQNKKKNWEQENRIKGCHKGLPPSDSIGANIIKVISTPKRQRID